MNNSYSILIRCDGNEKIGLGHVFRCLALADELRDSYHCSVSFAVMGDLGRGIIAAKKYPIVAVNEDEEVINQEECLINAIKKSACQVLILDFHGHISSAILESVRQKGILIVDIDDPDEKRLSADLAFYPPVPQVKKMDWTGFNGQLFSGWEWVLLRKEFMDYSQKARSINKDLRVLVTMGGSDPAGLTLKAVEALDLLEEDFETVIVLGIGFHKEAELKSLLSNTKRRYKICKNVSNISLIMKNIDIAIASFGVTAYELACMGVPAIYLCLSSDHQESASLFQDEGLALNMGEYTGVSTKDLAQTVYLLLHDKERRDYMAGKGPQLIDGKGSYRTAEKIMKSIRNGPALRSDLYN